MLSVKEFGGQNKMFNNLTFYTDGGCSGNPGPGGFGVVCLNTCYSQTISDYIERHTINYTYSEQSESTTNNKEELKAILHVLKIAAEHKEYNFTIYSDSAYAVNCLINWCPMWAKNNWTRKGNKPILNLELIQEMYSIYLKIKDRITIIKIGGHKGVLGNELADALSTGNNKKFNDLVKKFDIATLKIF